MKANKLLLRHKYLRIIELLREQKNIPYNEALDIFYNSSTYKEMANGISDMHCRSDIYLVEEIV
ncbi:MAG: hypothetical protein FWH22_05135 [Fibromonadales bacterium]|nr:hypothetical protein [Fibromonadales bacterium]